MDVKKRALIMASVAGLLAAGSFSVTAAQAEEGVPCYGVNKCKGAGACGGKGHSCAGKNACKGQGSVMTATAEDCLRIEGGSLTPKES